MIYCALFNGMYLHVLANLSKIWHKINNKIQFNPIMNFEIMTGLQFVIFRGGKQNYMILRISDELNNQRVMLCRKLFCKFANKFYYIVNLKCVSSLLHLF